MQDCPASWLLRPFKTAGHWANTRAFLYVLYLPFACHLRNLACEICGVRRRRVLCGACSVSQRPASHPFSSALSLPPCGIASGRTGFLTVGSQTIHRARPLTTSEMTGEVDGTRSAGQVAAPTSRRVLDETAADQDRGNASPLPSSRSRRGSLDGTFAEQDNGSASPAKRSGPGSPVQRLSADVSREDAGDRIVRKAEAALARTRFPVWEWSKALLEAKQFLAAALKEYGSGPTQLLKDKKPMLADLARRIKVVEAQIERQLMDDGERFEKLLEAGDYLTFISLMEHGWWLREELHGKGMPEVQEHVEELVLMLNNVAMHLVNTMTPDGIDTPAKLAYDLLNRALVLTTDSSDAVSDEAKRRLRAVTLNNMGCYYERRNKLLKSLEFLDRALKLELRVKLVEDPSATHLNLCRVLSRLERPEAAFQHVRCAIGERPRFLES